MNNNLKPYYNERVTEYDKVYSTPKEQTDLQKAITSFQELFANKSVLEFTCGTGYWTERIGKVAESVLATDINKSMLKIARDRSTQSNVIYQVTDMYNFKSEKNVPAFLVGLSGVIFWYSI